MLPKIGIVGKIGKKWQKLTKVDKRETLAKKGKRWQKFRKIGKSWQKLADVCKIGKICRKLYEVVRCC